MGQILKMDHLKQAEASQSPMVSTGGDKRPKKTYRRMIHLAIRNMHEKQGSSKQAIVNHITDNYQLGHGSINRINRALALMTTDNSLVKLDGAAGPLFKVNETKTIMPSTGCKNRRRRKRSSSRCGKRRRRKSKRCGKKKRKRARCGKKKRKRSRCGKKKRKRRRC